MARILNLDDNRFFMIERISSVSYKSVWSPAQKQNKAKRLTIVTDSGEVYSKVFDNTSKTFKLEDFKTALVGSTNQLNITDFISNV